MPVKGASGLWGGIVKGRQDAQAFRGNESNIEGKDINNARANAEFLHYVSTRKEATKILKGQAAQADIIIETKDQTIETSNDTLKSARASSGAFTNTTRADTSSRKECTDA